MPGRAGGCPPGPPTDPYVRNARIRFLKQSFCCPWMQSNGGLVTRLVSAESLSCVCPLNALPDVAFPPVGPVGLGSPLSPVLCDATTATVPLSGRFTCRSLPDTLRASIVRGVPSGLGTSGKAPRIPPGLLVTRSPSPGSTSRRPRALPRSRVPPVQTCPARRVEIRRAQP